MLFAVCGVVRNGGVGLSATLKCIERLRQHVGFFHFIIVTNDNDDETNLILNAWETASSYNILVLLDGLALNEARRTARIAAARNAYLDKIEVLYEAFELRFIVVLDLDGPNANIDAIQIVEVINESAFDWTALFANQRQGYYDLYALRHDVWCPNDCILEVECSNFSFIRCLPKVGNWYRRWNWRHLVYDRQYRINDTSSPIEVKSAFGGLAVYKAEALRGLRYAGVTACGEAICEHVVLHQQMIARGAKLFIHPGLLNDAPLEHLGPTSGKPFPYGT